jgi:hypothetical protein
MAPRACLWQSKLPQARIILGAVTERDFRLSSSELELRFLGKAYAVPEKVVVDLLDQGNLLVVTCYAVAGSISVEMFEGFAVPLQTQAKVSGTKENAASLSFCGTVVGVFVRCSLDASGTSSVLDR